MLKTFPDAPPGTPREDILQFPDYAEISYEGEFANEVEFYDALLRAHVGANSRVLEVGCGHGRIALPLARAGHAVTGIDWTLAMLDALRERARLQGLHVPGLLGDIRTIDLPPRSFDAAVCALGVVNLLWSRESLLAHLASLATAVRPGGVAIYLGPAAISPAALYPHVYEWERARDGVQTRTYYAFDRCKELGTKEDLADFIHELTVLHRGRYRLLEWRGRMRILSPAWIEGILAVTPQWRMLGWLSLFNPVPWLRAPLAEHPVSVFVLHRTDA